MQHGWMSDRLPNAIVHFTHIHSLIFFSNMAQMETSRQQLCSVGGYCATRLVPCYLWRRTAHCTALQRHIRTCIQYTSHQGWQHECLVISSETQGWLTISASDSNTIPSLNTVCNTLSELFYLSTKNVTKLPHQFFSNNISFSESKAVTFLSTSERFIWLSNGNCFLQSI